MHASLVAGGGPATVGEFFVAVVERITERISEVVADIAAMESAEGEGASTALAESADAGNPSVEQVTEPPPREDCGRKRHKTNRKAGC